MKILDLAKEIKISFDPKKSSKELPCIGLEHIVPQKLQLESYSYSSDVESLKYQFQNGDVLFGTMRPYFKKIIRAPFKGVCSTEISVIRAKDNSDTAFIFYLLAQDKFIEFATVNSNGDRPRTKWSKFSKFPVNNFSKEKRFKIGSVLTFYDDLIDTNRRRIQLLEETARLLFREWFVFFRFPFRRSLSRAKSRGSGQAGHEKVKIVDGVPEGWRKGFLGDIMTIKKGRNITFEQAIEGDIPVVGGGLEPTYYHNKANVCAPVVTISASGANAGYVNLYYTDVWVSDCSYMNWETTKYIFYLFLMLRSLQAYISGLQVGVAQPHVYPKDLNRLKVLIPPGDICERFELLVTPMFDLIKILKHQNQKLTQVRDLLLPRLMSGAIEV